jgi:hypothetical protein
LATEARDFEPRIRCFATDARRGWWLVVRDWCFVVYFGQA